MKKVALVLAVCFLVTACNTIRGVGKDIEKGGEAIQKSTN